MSGPVAFPVMEVRGIGVAIYYVGDCHVTKALIGSVVVPFSPAGPGGHVRPRDWGGEGMQIESCRLVAEGWAVGRCLGS